MKEKTLGLILGGLGLLGLAGCIVLFQGKDREAPRIHWEEDGLVYSRDALPQTLLSGVRAEDARDGDLTEAVVIEKVVTDREKATAVITYGVADRAGNVARAARTVEMEEEPEEQPADPPPAVPEGAEPEIPAEGAGEEDRETDPGEEGTGKEDRETEIREEEAEALPTAGEASNTESRRPEAQSDPGRPRILLKTREIRTRAGSAPAWVEAIEGLYDDTDDYAALLGTLSIRGEYDWNRAGSYPVTLTVTDREGKESEACPVTILVEE